MSSINPVKVPPQFEPIFKKSADTVAEYFKNEKKDPGKGTITVGDERYIMVRAASMSVEFFKIVVDSFKDMGEAVAHDIAHSMLFDVAHALGKADARAFREKMNLKDPIEKLSAGPVHFAYTGWAFVDISPESAPSPDENYFLLYDHPYSFESDSWQKSGEKAVHSVCNMNAGYSSGWCEESFGIPLVAVEIMCKACGDPCDRFIMAEPSRVQEYIATYQKAHPELKAERYQIPGFFQKKRQDEELRMKSADLEKMNALMIGREEKIIELKKEIEELKNKRGGGATKNFKKY